MTYIEARMFESLQEEFGLIISTDLGLDFASQILFKSGFFDNEDLYIVVEDTYIEWKEDNTDDGPELLDPFTFEIESLQIKTKGQKIIKHYGDDLNIIEQIHSEQKPIVLLSLKEIKNGCK